MGRVLVVGSYNQDTVLRVPRFPKPGETLAATALEHFHGGKGSNQAVAAARSGAQVRMAACVGRDAAGEAAMALWAAERIDATAVRRDAEVPTGTAVILLDAAGENEIVILAGANARLAPEDARAAATNAALVVAQLETPVEATIAAFLAAREAGGRTLLNAAPAADLPTALLAATDILVVNETEAERLVGRGGTPPELAAALAPRFASGVVLTAGAAGAFWGGRDGAALHLAAPPTEVLDSTGAGDAFVGAMAAALAEGLSMPGALRRGVVAGSLACRRLGAVPSLPGRGEILAAQ